MVAVKTILSTPRLEVAKPVPPKVLDRPVPLDCKRINPTKPPDKTN